MTDTNTQKAPDQLLHELRKREVQAIGAAISTQSWHGVEAAYNQLRDKMDTAGAWHGPAAEPQKAQGSGAGEACRVCGSTSLSWFAHNQNRSQVVEGRLKTNDIQCVFVLGCDACSETLRVVRAEKIASQLSAALSQPPEASEVEAVAWLYEKNARRSIQEKRQEWNVDRGWAETPLYAHPPKASPTQELQETGQEFDAAIEAAFLRDLADRLFRVATPAMGFDQGDTDQIYAIANRIAATALAQPAPEQGEG